jgi:serine/threonine protein kinase
MTFRHPFTGRTINGFINKIKKGEYPPLEGNYTQELKQLVSKMLIVDAKNRISIEEICKVKFIPNVNIGPISENKFSGAELNSLGLKSKKGDGIEKKSSRSPKIF